MKSNSQIAREGVFHYGCKLMSTAGALVPTTSSTTGTAFNNVPAGSEPSGSCTLLTVCVTPAISPGAEPLKSVIPATPAKETCGL